MRSLLERHWFIVVDLRKITADVRVICQMIKVYLCKILLTASGNINLPLRAIFMAPFIFQGTILSKVFPANPDLLLSQIVLAGKKTE